MASSEKLGWCGKFLENSKPYLAMISLQFGYSGMMNIISKVSLNQGMSQYVLVFYRHAFATAVIAPFAFFFERKAQPRITFRIFMKIFILALLGMEKIQNKEGEMPSKDSGNISDSWWGHVDEHYTKRMVHYIGSLFLIIATLAWASLFVLQARVIETYQNHQLSLTSLVCFIGTLQAVAVTFVAEHNPSVWRIGWDMNLLLLMLVVGSFLIVMELYSVLWGKHKESMEANKAIETDQEMPPILHLKPPNNYHHHVDPKILSEDHQLFICADAASKSEKIPEATQNNMNQCFVIVN